MPERVDLVIAIPTAGRVPMGFAYSLAGMVAKLGSGCPTMPETTISVTMDISDSSNWITNREQLAKRAIDSGKTHLLFLDDDMVFEPNVLEILLGRRQPIVTTNYLIKTVECDSFVAVGMNGQRLPTLESNTGLQPILYTGFGVSLFEVEVFKKAARPWFMPDYDPDSHSYTTEDNPFYRRAREAGYPVYLDHDASKLVSHIGQKAWNWKEYKHG